MRPIRLELRGHVPSKASMYRRSWRGARRGLHITEQACTEIAGLRLQLNAQWAGRKPLAHPEVTIQFHLCNDAQDRDGALKTTLDLLQIAGVIKNDNIRNFNGWLHVAPAVVSSEEKVVIELREGNDGVAA